MKMMATLTFDQARRTEAVAFAPQQREHIRELTEAGTVLALYVQVDLSRVWLALQGADDGEIRQALESLPLFGFVTNLDLAALAE